MRRNPPLARILALARRQVNAKGLLQEVQVVEGNLILLSSVSAGQDFGVSGGGACVDARRSSMRIVAVVYHISCNTLRQSFSAATCTVYSGCGV